MLTKRNMNRIVFLILLYIINLNTYASSNNAETIERLKPCIDDQTFAVIHLNLEKVNLDAMVDLIITNLKKTTGSVSTKPIQDDLGNFKKLAGMQLSELRKAGCRDIYAVFSMYDFPYFFVVVPISPNVNRDNLSEKLNNIVEEAFNIEGIQLHVTEDFILIGMEQTITRARAISPFESKALKASFNACSDSSIQIVLFPSSDQRRILIETLPEIQSESDTIELKALAKDIQWIAMDFNTPPAISINMTIQSSNSEAAQRISLLMQNLFSMINTNPKIVEAIPDMEKVIKYLTPEKQNDNLVLQMDSSTAKSFMNDLITPLLLQVNATKTRYSCATNLKGIGMALFIYANDYEDKFPPDLKTLTTTAQMPEAGIICSATREEDSYIYRGAGLSISDVPFLITVYDKKDNHQGGRYVLFLDGHVEWVAEEDMQEIIDKDNQYRKDNELPGVPLE